MPLQRGRGNIIVDFKGKPLFIKRQRNVAALPF